MNFCFQFGCPSAGLTRGSDSLALSLPNPVIAGTGRELWAEDVRLRCERAPLTLWRQGAELWGVGLVPVGGGLRDSARRLYRDIFQATRQVSLYRIWNFVPHINEADVELENYRAFCQGRALAFDEFFGDQSEPRMPAASAVGTRGDALCVAFLAGPDPVRHVENPHQVPAYRYPSRYGPRAPSFARASVVEGERGLRLYVSGTASIRGSDSLHPGDVTAQLELALENLHEVTRAAGAGDSLEEGRAGKRLFRLYLRHPEQWAAARAVLHQRLLRDGDVWSVVQADICRRELLVEIDGARILDNPA